MKYSWKKTGPLDAATMSSIAPAHCAVAADDRRVGSGTGNAQLAIRMQHPDIARRHREQRHRKSGGQHHRPEIDRRVADPDVGSRLAAASP
jgi:hypothetical protein